MSLFVLPVGSETSTIRMEISFSGGAGSSLASTACPTDDENTLLQPTNHGRWKRYHITSSSGDNTSMALVVHPAYNDDCSLDADVTAQGTQIFYGIQVEAAGEPTKYIQNTTAGSSVSVMDRLQNPLNDATFTLD